VPPDDLNQLLHPTIDTNAALDLLATGLPASPGAASGAAVFDADRAEERGKNGEAVILVRRETSPEDFHGMVAARAVLTARGGMTSHAAVVARGMGKPCVVGATTLEVDEGGSRFAVNGRGIKEGDWITLDGATGKVYAGRAALRDAGDDRGHRPRGAHPRAGEAAAHAARRLRGDLPHHGRAAGLHPAPRPTAA
jgi:pyruvate,orthophosphate dikinase